MLTANDIVNALDAQVDDMNFHLSVWSDQYGNGKTANIDGEVDLERLAKYLNNLMLSRI